MDQRFLKTDPWETFARRLGPILHSAPPYDETPLRKILRVLCRVAVLREMSTGIAGGSENRRKRL